MTDRTELLAAINDERNYQVRRWGIRQEDGSFHEIHKPIENFILYMEHYLEKAREAITLSNDDNEPLNELRKVVALGVACFEQHHMNRRDMSQQVINNRDGKPS